MGYQHVIYSGISGFFENASRCIHYANVDYSYLNQILPDIHTSQMVAFPATVYIHNSSPVAGLYNVSVYEGKFGTLKGVFTLSVEANMTYSLPFSYFEQQVGWSPGTLETHGNLGFVPVGTQGYYLGVGQAIFNLGLKAYVNMSLFCNMNR